MDSKQVRKKFISFFEKKNHFIAKSSSLVIKDDPSLMFVNAGMNQFKDIFLGNSKVKNSRIVNSQRCLRVSGKHNDLEEVGHDTYHHTMFEMLGNWSFGDYFKKESIHLAWDFLTKELKLSEDRLYVSFFKGDTKDELKEDSETKNIWNKILSSNKIIGGVKKDNFWEMGKIGPCGPSTEIHIDLRSDIDRKKEKTETLINKDHPEVIEIWNIVFIEFNRKEKGALELLPKKHVDTGMGLERLCMILQNKKSTYDTDVFSSLINAVCIKSGYNYHQESKLDVAIRVIVDHIRAVSFTIADGQIPSNIGAGYVIRRILRRAVRYGFSFLDFKTPFLYELVDIVFEQFKDVFPEIYSQKLYVKNIVEEEEKIFFKTLEKGTIIIDNMIKDSKSKQIDSYKVFELYDTYGFPKDLTALILKENDMSFSEEEFSSHLDKQKKRSRSASNILAKDWVTVSNKNRQGFMGYKDPFKLHVLVRILMFREVKIKDQIFFQVILNQTPFYPEGGGQVGDQGILKYNDEQIQILDTKKENNLILHLCDRIPKKCDVEFLAQVDFKKRILTTRNHTATHLLHEALIDLLGSHVEQKGSLVNAQYLRFDFSHFEPLDAVKIEQIEKKVNKKILLSIDLQETIKMPFKEAKKMGAIALFGEKYGDFVRVVQFRNSIELCGGTHVRNTSEIGFFKIISEHSVASGVRRVEAVTSFGVSMYYQKFVHELDSIKQVLKNSQNPTKVIENLISENKKMKEDFDILEKEKLSIMKKELLKSNKIVNGVNTIVSSIDVSPKLLKNISFELIKDAKNLFLVLATVLDGKFILNMGISKDLIKNKNWKASELINNFLKDIDAAGGGQDFFASASGSNLDNLDIILSKINSFLKKN